MIDLNFSEQFLRHFVGIPHTLSLLELSRSRIKSFISLPEVKENLKSFRFLASEKFSLIKADDLSIVEVEDDEILVKNLLKI